MSLGIGLAAGYVTGGGGLLGMGVGLLCGALLSGMVNQVIEMVINPPTKVPSPQKHEAMKEVTKEKTITYVRATDEKAETVTLALPTAQAAMSRPWKNDAEMNVFTEQLRNKRYALIDGEMSPDAFQKARTELQEQENKLDQHLANAWENYTQIRQWEEVERPKILKNFGAQGREEQFKSWLESSGGLGSVNFPPSFAMKMDGRTSYMRESGIMNIAITQRLSDFTREKTQTPKEQWDATPPHQQLTMARKIVHNELEALDKIKIKYGLKDQINDMLENPSQVGLAYAAKGMITRYNKVAEKDPLAALKQLKQEVKKLDSYGPEPKGSEAEMLRDYVTRMTTTMDMNREIEISEDLVVSRLNAYSNLSINAGQSIDGYTTRLPDLAKSIMEKKQDFISYLSNEEAVSHFEDKDFGVKDVKLVDASKTLSRRIEGNYSDNGEEIVMEVLDKRNPKNVQRIVQHGIKQDAETVNIHQWALGPKDRAPNDKAHHVTSHWEKLPHPIPVSMQTGEGMHAVLSAIGATMAQQQQGIKDSKVLLRNITNYNPNPRHPNSNDAFSVIEVQDTTRSEDYDILHLVGIRQKDGKVLVTKMSDENSPGGDVSSYVAMGYEGDNIKTLEKPIVIDPKNLNDLRKVLDAEPKRTPQQDDFYIAADYPKTVPLTDVEKQLNPKAKPDTIVLVEDDRDRNEKGHASEITFVGKMHDGNFVADRKVQGKLSEDVQKDPMQRAKLPRLKTPVTLNLDNNNLDAMAWTNAVDMSVTAAPEARVETPNEIPKTKSATTEKGS